jgi:hypothetical protein
VSADEIFVLILVAACAGTLLAIELHSRRQQKAVDAAAPSRTAVATAASDTVVDEAEPAKSRGKTRRK